VSFKLEIFESSGDQRHYIAWVDTTDGEEGARLGESRYTERDLASASPENWVHIKATLVAEQTAGVIVPRERWRNFQWERAADAKAALRAIRAALRDKSSKPWPEWAVKAKAAGWVPPKGWKP
jgi:hypothetical protein